jgi:alpha-glucosidase
MDGYRVFTWNTRRSRTRPGCSNAAGMGFRVITIIDPGVKYEPGYAVFDQARERDVLCRTEGGNTTSAGVAGQHRVPDFVTEEAAGWWGELNAAHVHPGWRASGTT